MSKSKLKLSYSGIGELMRGPEMAQLMNEHGSRIAQSAGAGYSFRVHNTGKRQAANIYPGSEEALQDNYDNNTLLKCIR